MNRRELRLRGGAAVKAESCVLQSLELGGDSSGALLSLKAELQGWMPAAPAVGIFTWSKDLTKYSQVTGPRPISLDSQRELGDKK